MPAAAQRISGSICSVTKGRHSRGIFKVVPRRLSIEQPLRLQRNPKGLGPQLASSEAIPKKAEQGRLGSGGGLFGPLVHRSMKQLAPQTSEDTALHSNS